MTTSSPASLALLRGLVLLLLSFSLLSHTTHSAPRVFSHHPRHLHLPSRLQSRPEIHNSRIITTEADGVFQQWKDAHATAAWSAAGRSLAALNTTTAKIEAEALLSIKSAIHTDPLRSLANWTLHSTFAHCSGWQGVTCNAMGQVVGLDLRDMGLVGSISPMIGNLEHLSFLNLSTNRLSGPFPPHLIQCRALTVVELSANSLHGELSSELLYTFPQLQYLRLSYNAFSGPLPEVPKNTCRSLRTLGISATNVSGVIPSSLKRCQNLEILGLGLNQLIGTIPGSLGELHRLQVLQLEENSALTGPIPKSLGNLSSLTILWLYSNQLIGSIPSDLASLKNLQVLNLNNNSLSGPIPKFLGGLSSLVLLDLSSNQFSGSIPSDFALLKNLEVLVLSNNSLSGLIPKFFGSLSSLVQLDLGYNQFIGPIPKSLGNLSSLTILGLEGNQFNGSIPSDLASLKNLQVLYLEKNNLSGPIPKFLGSLPSLVFLELRHNQFTGRIPSKLGFLKELKVLDLKNNNLTGPIPASLGNCSSLRYLNLGYNNLTGTIPHEFENFGLWANLEAFAVSHNNLTGSIPSFSSSINSNLIGLDFSYNNFGDVLPTHINGSHLSSLYVIFLNNNKLEGPIPPWFGGLKGLQILDLSNNKLVGSVPQNFGNLDGYKFPYNTSTTSKILQQTQIISISSAGFSFTLSISFYITLPRGIHTYIILGETTYMDLSSNALEGEIPATIANLIGMKYLIVSNNKFQGHIPPAFQNLMGLEILDLSQNNFIGPIPTTFSSTLNALTIFNVSFNNLSGDIPTANQFSTFGVSSYLPGNPRLCGSVINRSCVISNNESLSASTIGDRLYVSNYINVPAFGIGAICGFSIVAITTFIFRPTFNFVFGGEIRRRADIKHLAITNVQQQRYGLFKYPT